MKKKNLETKILQIFDYLFWDIKKKLNKKYKKRKLGKNGKIFLLN